MTDTFNPTISRQQLSELAPDLLNTLRTLVEYGQCRQNNRFERESLAKKYRDLAQQAVKKYPALKLNHMGAKTIIIE